MRAGTPRELLSAVGWNQVPLFLWLVSIVWFVRFYLGAGRLWLAWTVSGMRGAYLLLNFVVVGNVNYVEIRASDTSRFSANPSRSLAVSRTP